MSLDGLQSPADRLRWFEEQVVRLYGRSQFLRQDEVAHLKESAQALDRHAALLTLLETQDERGYKPVLERKVLRRLISRLRKRQSGRKDEASQLSGLRERGVKIRKEYLQRSWVRRLLARWSEKKQREREQKLRADTLAYTLRVAEERNRAALNLAYLVTAEKLSDTHFLNAPAEDSTVAEVLVKFIQLKRKRHILEEMLKSMKTDDRVRQMRGERCPK
ncbi:MAG: hypothetical protein RL189_2605 [Pseudomonadota bacterium]|jgi:hypothetical protein